MDTRLFLEPQQGASYQDQLDVATAAEAAGFSALFRSDHFLRMGSTDGQPGPSDAWITLAGLARDTDSIRLGTLVTSASFRHAGLLAVSVAQVDAMSGGRVELGLGAGWFEAEHEAMGVPFLALGDRFDVLEDQLAILTGMWATPDGETFSHEGLAVSVSDVPGLPKPVQAPHPPIVIGGRGKKRTPALTARYASEFNLPFAPVADFAGQVGRVTEACEAIDRDPTELDMSIALIVCCAETDDELARRAARLGREVDELKENGLAGTPDEIVEKLGTYAAAGATRAYLQFLDLEDLEQIELLGRTVVPALAEI